MRIDFPKGSFSKPCPQDSGLGLLWQDPRGHIDEVHLSAAGNNCFNFAQFDVRVKTTSNIVIYPIKLQWICIPRKYMQALFLQLLVRMFSDFSLCLIQWHVTSTENMVLALNKMHPHTKYEVDWSFVLCWPGYGSCAYSCGSTYHVWISSKLYFCSYRFTSFSHFWPMLT